MVFSFEFILLITILLVYIDIVFMCKLIINKAKKEEHNDAFAKQYKALIDVLSGAADFFKSKYFLKGYAELSQSVQLNEFKYSKEAASAQIGKEYKIYQEPLDFSEKKELLELVDI